MKSNLSKITCLVYVAIIGGCLQLSACLKVDKPNTPNAVESFQGDMRLRFAIEELNPGVHGINFGFFRTSPTGDKMIISQIPNNSFEVIPAKLFTAMIEALKVAPGKEDTGAYEMASAYDLSILPPEKAMDEIIQTPTFAGLLADVSGNVVTITGFEMANATAKALNCSARGTIERSGGTMMTTETIEIYCPTEYLIDFFGELPLSFLMHDNSNEPIIEREEVILWFGDIHYNQALSVTS